MEAAKKILLVQLYSNGDCLYATAIARQIKQDYPGCHLTWAISSFCKSIIAHNPYVDEILEVKEVPKNDTPAIRRFKRKVQQWKQKGDFDELFITHNADTNHAFYDGCIRSSIFRAYPKPITVPVTPVLRLTAEEINKATQFAEQHELGIYRNVVLFEFAPQSGQSKMTKEMAVRIAERLVLQPGTAVILSSANQVVHDDKAVIDGSSLTLRETAALTHHCSLLLGSSSGITWISTADTAKLLPMVQLLNPDTMWVNPISRDFERFHLPTEKVIELLSFDEDKIINCVEAALRDFSNARTFFNQPVPLHFRTTRGITCNLLTYLEFGAIARHIKVNREVYGDNIQFYLALISGFLVFPFRLIKNLVSKRLLNKKNQ